MTDLVLIDDDILIHGTWSMVARTKKQSIQCFLNIDDFLAAKIPHETPIYVDYHFFNGDNGSEICTKLAVQGFKNLYIATGSSRKVTNPPSVVKAVVGKDYPM